MAITEQIGDKDFVMVIVRPCLKGSVLDCLMWTSTWLGEWELGTSVMSLEAAFLLPTNLPLKGGELVSPTLRMRNSFDSTMCLVGHASDACCILLFKFAH